MRALGSCKLWLAFFVACLVGCAPPPRERAALDAGAYALALHGCLDSSSTCEGYAACANRAAEAFGSPRRLRCVP